MNREKDFQVVGSGTIVNKNTKDFHRARNRRQIAKEHKEALGKSGKFEQVLTEVKELNKMPLRTTKMIQSLQSQFEDLNAKDVKRLDALEAKLEEQIEANEVLRRQLIDAITECSELSAKVDRIIGGK